MNIEPCYYNKVIILSLSKLIKIDEENFDLSNYAIISFKDEIHDHLELLDKYNYLEIEFDDIKKCPYGCNEENIFPHGDKIAKFIKENIMLNKIIICQCVYGNSRSAGCAAAILDYYLFKGNDIKNNSNYSYNPLVYKCVLKALKKNK